MRHQDTPEAFQKRQDLFTFAKETKENITACLEMRRMLHEQNRAANNKPMQDFIKIQLEALEREIAQLRHNRDEAEKSIQDTELPAPWDAKIVGMEMYEKSQVKDELQCVMWLRTEKPLAAGNNQDHKTKRPYFEA